MATLLDLTSQGDVAMIADESRLADVLWGCRRSSWARSASLPSSPAWSWPAEVNEFAFNAPSRRLKVIGFGLPG